MILIAVSTAGKAEPVTSSAKENQLTRAGENTARRPTLCSLRFAKTPSSLLPAGVCEWGHGLWNREAGGLSQRCHPRRCGASVGEMGHSSWLLVTLELGCIMLVPSPAEKGQGKTFQNLFPHLLN